MQDFGQPPEDPLQNPLDGPFEDPFEAVSNTFGPAANFDLFNPFDYTQAQLEELFMDDLGRRLNQLEDGIENSQPILVEPEMPNIHVQPFEDQDSESSAGQHNNQDVRPEQGTMHPQGLPSYDIEAPEQLKHFHKQPYRSVGGRIGRRGGRGFMNSHAGPGDKIYCPVEKDYVVFPDFCQGQDCQYYDENSDSENGGHCTYYDEDEKA